MRIGIVGCGFVADNYIAMIAAHPNLELVGVYDRDPARLAVFTQFHKLHAIPSLEALLTDPQIQLIVNLTNPSSHFAISMAALQAGKHVYSEKPLAMTMADAHILVDTAQRLGLGLTAAPCNHLSDATATLEREVKSGRLGRIVMVNAEMDDGMVAKLDYPNWRSKSGAPWPAKDEFEVGCTMEHAGYHITPLVRLFGPVRRVTSFSACLFPNKGADIGIKLDILAPDLSIGILEFDNGIIARLSCTILAPANRSLRIIGEDGVATLSDVWEYLAPVRVAETGKGFRHRFWRKIEKKGAKYMTGLLFGGAAKHVAGDKIRKTAGGHEMDFARGIAQLAAQLESGAPPFVGPELALHVTEVTLALTSTDATARTLTMQTSLP